MDPSRYNMIYNNSQHCGFNNVACCCVRVEMVSKRMQQLPTTDATCNIQQCCVRLHEALLTIGRRRRRQRKRQKSNTLDRQKKQQLCTCIMIFVHFSVEYVNTRQKLSFSFRELQLQKNLPTCEELNEMEYA